jgi:hypothetical protein
LSFLDLDFGSRFDFLERFQALAVARLRLVLGEIEALDALFCVVVAPPASQIVQAGTARRWHGLSQEMVLSRVAVLVL